MTGATRAAFLVQATALFTPLLAAAFGMAPSALLWLSSLVALAATLLVTLDQADPSGAAAAGGGGIASLLGGASLGEQPTGGILRIIACGPCTVRSRAGLLDCVSLH